MELPFTVVFEPPSRAELRALLRLRRTWVAGVLVTLAIGTPVVVSTVGHTDAVASGVGVPLQVTSRPAGAGVWVDGRERGRTPVEVQVDPGPHRVLLKARDALDGQYAVQVGGEPAALDAVLWRSQARLARLRPSLPGAELSDVRLLADGQLALSIALPPGRQMQAWRLDPRSGGLEPVLTDVAAARLIVAPDSQHVAFVGYEVGPPGPGSDASARPSVLWLAQGEHLATMAGWRPSLAPGEELVEASWSPHADRLVVVTAAQLAAGGARSRLWLLDPESQQGREVLTLPSQIAPGSALWSPDGQHVALVAHAGVLNALCLLDVDGSFRYVADLESSSASPLGYLPASWSADSQRLVFVAPDQHPPGVPFGWLQSDGRRGLYVATTTDPTPLRMADTTIDFAAWREDGQLLGLGRVGIDHALAIRMLEGAASGQQLLDLPLWPAAGYAALWDLDRARLVLASRNQAGSVDYWLATFGLEDPS